MPTRASLRVNTLAASCDCTKRGKSLLPQVPLTHCSYQCTLDCTGVAATLGHDLIGLPIVAIDVLALHRLALFISRIELEDTNVSQSLPALLAHLLDDPRLRLYTCTRLSIPSITTESARLHARMLACVCIHISIQRIHAQTNQPLFFSPGLGGCHSLLDIS